MFNMVQELAHAPEGKRISSLSQSVCSFLLSCYKGEGSSLSIVACDNCFKADISFNGFNNSPT